MNNYLSPLDILTLFTRETAQDSHMRDFYEIPSPINLRYNCRSAAYIAEGCLYIVAEMPGLSPGDFTLEVKDNIVTLLGDVNSKFKKYESHVKAAPKNVGGFSEKPYKVIVNPYSKLKSEATEKSYENGMVKIQIPLDLDIEPNNTYTF